MPNRKRSVPDLFRVPYVLAGVSANSTVLLALSGGADSCVLLDLLDECACREGFPLLLAHVNHGIRGEEALRDRAFCLSLAEQYHREICVLDADVPALAKQHGTGLEEEARRVRYAFFEELMRERDIPLLATAHHADDNMETVLFRMGRGTGTAGLGGIAPCRPFGNGFLTRPLLEISRKDVMRFCAERGLKYVTDSTNADQSLSRNRIRAQITPVMESLFDDPQAKVLQMTRSLREDEAYLSELSDALYGRAREGGSLKRSVLANAPAPLGKRVLAHWVLSVTGHHPEAVHLNALFDLVSGRTPSAEAALTGEYFAALECGLLRIFRKKHGAFEPFHIPLRCEERVFPDTDIRISVRKRKKLTKIHNLSTQSCINLKMDSVIMNGGLYWRPRREGDTLLQGGCHKRLKTLYAANGIPSRRRGVIPLLCDGEGIVWAPFAGARDGVLTQGDGEALLLTVELLAEEMKNAALP